MVTYKLGGYPINMEPYLEICSTYIPQLNMDPLGAGKDRDGKENGYVSLSLSVLMSKGFFACCLSISAYDSSKFQKEMLRSVHA